MKRSLILLALSLLVCIGLRAQQLPDTATLNYMMRYFPPLDIKPAEATKLNSLPVMKMPVYYRTHKISLPYLVDNSLLPYFRPIGWQQGYECGQSAGIAYNFTYELDRLRDVSALLLENQIVTHFSWDFLNDGQQYVGASAFDGWEVVRAAGSPNAVDYGGSISYGDHTRWMSGYNTYYAGMHNRLISAYQLNVSTMEGLMILKQWMYDHLDGSLTGGVANCYMGYFSPSETLPAGTPEAGKAVRTSNSGSGHTWTLVGYNDSIRWDYNGDGQYTTDIDINGDGQVNLQDCEIGGLKFANGYAGTGWGNNGFCYLMYKCLADPYGAGGIWNNTVFTLKIKEDCNPQLTYKVTLKHTCRNMLKVKAGIALNTSATKPEFYLDFPIFNYQGGAMYMQGGTTEADKTIEFGLDCTPLLSYVTPGQSVRYFLDVYENDPSSANTGEIVNFSVIDYASGLNESIYPGTNIPLNNYDTTRLSLLKTVTFNKVGITTDTLPTAPLNEPYSFQLTAANGAPPYRWDMDYTATESNAPAAFPTASTTGLVFSNNGYAVQNLNFSFPYCGKKYNQIFVSPDGFIKFDNGLYTWPFLVDGDLLNKSTCLIGPFVTDLAFYTGEGAWYDGDAQSATFRWKASLNGVSATDANFAIKLFPSGKIEFYYGTVNVTAGTHWLSGISAGDNRNYQYTASSEAFYTNSTPFCITLIPPVFPDGLELSDEGIISGTATQELNNVSLPIRVTDNNEIWSVKSLQLNTKGVMMTYTMEAGGDTIVQAGETVKINLKLKNIGLSDITGASLEIADNDTMVSLIDSTEWVGDLAAGDSTILDTAFTIVISPDAFEGYEISLPVTLYSPTDTFHNNIRIVVHSFILEAGMTSVADGNNNQLEPGETAALIIELKNTGGATANDIDVHLSCADPYISVGSADAHVDSLSFSQSSNMFFIITASPSLPAQRIIVFNLDITASGNYHNHDFVVLIIGEYGETFESGNFTSYPWVLSGNNNWFIQDTVVYAGDDAAQSGDIIDNQTSTMSLSMNVLADGQVRFFRKVSCEQDNTNHNYDYLAFYIDGAEQQRWDGNQNWAEAVFNVTAGNRTLRWSYVKDYSVSTGYDCGWLDNIIFPPFGDADPNLEIAPLSVYQQVYFNSADTQAINLTNSGTGLIIYTGSVSYLNPQTGSSWLNPEYYAGNIESGHSMPLNLIFDAAGMAVGTYSSTLTIQSNFLNPVSIPVTMEVVSTAGIDEYSPLSFSARPNPFNAQVQLEFDVTDAGKTEMAIYDLSGRKVRNLLPTQELGAGHYSLVWDGMNDNGNAISAGIYFCALINGNERSVIKLVCTP